MGADIGGTFTDLFAIDLNSGRCFSEKVLTDREDPTKSVAAGLQALLDGGKIQAAAVTRVLHATTLVTNTVILRRGAKTALLLTEGFRDALEIGTEHRYDLYDLNLEKPPPIVPRHLRRPIRERMRADGSVEIPLDVDRARQEISHLLEEGVNSFAICFHHSYRNASHEQQAALLISEMAPDIHVSLSSQVAPEIREYQRSSTVAINAYVAPMVAPYLRSLEQKLAELEIPASLLIMQSNGGTVTAETSGKFPVRLLESGPAAGAIGAASLAQSMGRRNVLFFDMGGTTAKASIVDDGKPLISRQLEVAHVYRFKEGSGLPVQVPSVDMIEIGAGGGSIASVDRMGLLKVGPLSAESDPGPACYGRGGEHPTVTDADLVLGYIGAESFLGGRMALDVEAARRAISDHISKPLGYSLEEAAWGIHQVVNENMAAAARIHMLDRGKNPADYTMAAFGGAGPTHAYGVMRALGMREALIPWQAGVGSAFGLLCAPVSFESARSLPVPLAEVNWPAMGRMMDEMAEECRRMVEWAGVAKENIGESKQVDMRFRGQGHEIRVSLDGLRWPQPSVEEILNRFHSEYRTLNAFQGPDAPVDMVTWRVMAGTPPPALPNLDGLEGAPPEKTSSRSVYFQDAGGFVAAEVLSLASFAGRGSLEGPAIVELGDANVTVGPGGVLERGKEGILLLRLEK